MNKFRAKSRKSVKKWKGWRKRGRNGKLAIDVCNPMQPTYKSESGNNLY